MADYSPKCHRCGDTNDIGHEPGAFTDALGHGPNCPDCGGNYTPQLLKWKTKNPRAIYSSPDWKTFWPTTGAAR